MPDQADMASQVKKVMCPECPERFEDIDPDVAYALLGSHYKRKHKGA